MAPPIKPLSNPQNYHSLADFYSIKTDKMPAKKDLEMVLGSCVELLESEIGDLHYPDEEATHLCTIARQVGETLIEEGVDSKPIIIAATLGDLPYSQANWRKKVDTMYGKKAGSLWHELARARIHGHRDDCVKSCDCDTSEDCEHTHVEGCNEGHCVMKRLQMKAPHMSGPARVAMMAWFAVLSARVAGKNAPKDWTREHRAEYLSKIEAVAHAIKTKGSKTNMDDVIKKFADQIAQTVKDF